MRPYLLTPKAEDDIFEIWCFIALNNLDAADRLEAEVFDACQHVADKPDLGHYRRDLTTREVRFFSVRGTYLVVYNPSRKPLEIIRVLHGSRNAVSELKPD
jgi:plasmid stabilization system protein ParE